MKAYSGANLIVRIVVSEIFVNCPAIYTVTKKVASCAETRLRDAMEAYRCATGCAATPGSGQSRECGWCYHERGLRKLHVTCSGTRSDCVRYDCRGNLINHGSSERPQRPQRNNPPSNACPRRAAPWTMVRCMSFGGLRADQRVAQEVLRQLEPLGLRAALAAIDQCAQRCSEQIRHKELALQQAQFEAARARRQYDAVDPEHRLVASELERRWNEALRAQVVIEEELESLRHEPHQQLSEEQSEQLIAMGEDIAELWRHPNASAVMKKRILHTVLEEIVVRIVEHRIAMVLHWRGGDHTELEFAKNRTG